MAARTSEITIPNVRLALEELLDVIQGLDQPARARVAQAVAEAEMDARFKHLLDQLALQVPTGDFTDADIDREVRAVRALLRPA